MANYYDPNERRLKTILWAWDSIPTWDDITLTWHLGDGGYISSIGTPDIIYYTDIEDFGRVADINPLCTVNAIGDVVIKVYAATSIDSSSLLPGDPVIDTSDSTDPVGVRARYFQFRIEVFTPLGGDVADTSISRVVTKLKATKQTETLQGDSATHAGTVDERIVPITQNYSKISSLIGTAEYQDTGIDSAGVVGDPYVDTGYVADSYIIDATSVGDASEIPVVIVRSLADNTQPKYAVFTTNGTNRDHYVYLQVSGLPRMQVSAQGNIVEQ